MADWMGGLLKGGNVYTVAQVELVRKRMELGSWESVSWDIKKVTGLEVSTYSLARYARRASAPDARLKFNGTDIPQPTNRYLVSQYLGIQEKDWWTRHRRSHKRSRDPWAKTIGRPLKDKPIKTKNPYDSRAFGEPKE